MRHFELSAVLEATGGVLLSEAAHPSQAFEVCTDSRRATEQTLFVALVGDVHDAHRFIPSVLENTRSAILGEKDKLEALLPTLPSEWIQGRAIIGVSDTLFALGQLGASVRSSFKLPVVGITGSVGKTSTKDLVRGVLEKTGPGLSTPGNYNNLVGLPLTLFMLEPEHRWMVLEMGMNRFGEIERLAEIARPQVRLITCVAAAHTEGVGDIEGVARAKGELFATARPGDILVVNLDDPRVRALPRPSGTLLVTYGEGTDAMVRLETCALQADGTTALVISLNGQQLSTPFPLLGRHNARNATAAAAVGLALGLSVETIAVGLKHAHVSPMRMERSTLPGDILILNDAYNANPASMEAALQTLCDVQRLRRQGRAIAVLGDMFELGALEAEAHQDLGRRVVDLGISSLFVCGPRAEGIRAGALAQGMPAEKVVHSLDHAQLAEALNAVLQPGDVVLLKGSRGARMEKVLHRLQQLHGMEGVSRDVH